MQKAILILLVGLLWCNVGFAGAEIVRFTCGIDKKSLSYPFVGKLSDEQQSYYIGKQLFFTINFTKGYIKNDSHKYKTDDDLRILHGLGEEVFNFDPAEFSFRKLFSGLPYVAQLQISDELIYNYKGKFKITPKVLRVDIYENNNSTNDALLKYRFEFRCRVDY